MDISGQCFCGFIQYDTEINEDFVFICHCTNCQRHSSNAFRVIAGIVDNNFKLISGELSSYEKLADSGSLRSRTFYPKCGCNIYATTIGEGLQFMGLLVASIDQREKLVPVLQLWCRSAQPWAIQDSLPRFEQQPSTEEIVRLMGR